MRLHALLGELADLARQMGSYHQVWRVDFAPGLEADPKPVYIRTVTIVATDTKQEGIG